MKRIPTGFTLVELLVVIGIIAILASLVLAVSGGILATSERKQVEDTFTLLDKAIRELELSRGQELVFSRITTDSTPELDFYDIKEQPVGQPAYIMPELLKLLTNNDRSREFISKMNPDFLKRTGLGTTASPYVLDLVDTWGKRIAVVPCGRPATEREMRSAYRTVGSVKGNPVTADPLGIGIDSNDRTVRTNDEKYLGVCSGRRWTFVSAGPDQNLGAPPWATTQSDVNKDGVNDWNDNIFSQPLNQPVLTLP